MTPYAQMLAANLRPEAQAAFAYEYQRQAKDPTVAQILAIVLGVVGGESYYLGNYMRGVLMSLAVFSGIGLLVTVPMWICRCFTIAGECDTYNDYLAYSLAMRYWSYANAEEDRPAGQAPVPPPSYATSSNQRPHIGGLPVPVRSR